MNIPKVILMNTLNEILNDDRKSEDTKNTVRDLFTNGTSEEINESILKNIMFFSSTSLLKYIINEKEVIDKCLEIISSGESYTAIYFLEALENNGALKDFLLTDEAYNLLVSNNDVLKIVARNTSDFFEIYSGERRDTLLALFKGKEDFSTADLDALPKEEQTIMLENPLIRQKIYQDFSHSSFAGISEDTEELLWNSFKSDLATLSLSLRLSVFDKLNDSLKKEAFAALRLDNDIDNIPSYQFDKVAPFIDQSVLMEKAFNPISGKIDDKCLKYLTSENQVTLLNDLMARKVNVVSINIFDCLTLEVKQRAFEIFSNVLTPDTIYNLYLETNNAEYLNVLKEKVLSKSSIMMSDFLYDDNFISLCSEEEKNVIASKLKGFSYIATPSSKGQNFNPYFYREYIKNVIGEYSTKGKQVTISFKDFKEYLTSEEQDQLFPLIKLDDWLSKILYDVDTFDFLLNLLKNNPNYFKGKDFSKIEPHFFVNDELVERIDEIIGYFDEEQLVIFFNDNVLESNDKLKNIFRSKTLNNPSLITSVFKYNCFTEEEKESLLTSMDLGVLSSLIDRFSYSQIDISDILFKRFEECIEFINNNRNGYNIATTIYNKLDSKEKVNFINRINNIYVLNTLFNMTDIEESMEDKEIILARQLELYNEDYYKICISDNYFTNRIDLNKFGDRDIDLFINTADMKMLIYVSTYYSNKKIVDKIISNIENDISSLLSDDIYPILNNFLFKLDDSNRKKIESIVDTYLSNNEFYQSHLKGVVKDFNLKEKVNFLNIFNNKNMTEEKQELFLQLLNKNPYLLSTLDPVLLSDDMIGMGFHFIDKTSKYSVLQSKIKITLMTRPELAPFLRQVSSYLQEKELSDATYDKKISMIIEYLADSRNKLTDYDFNNVNSDNISDVIEYILHNYVTIEGGIKTGENIISDRIESLYDFSIENFTAERLRKCDELFSSSNDIDVMKNIYLNKYLSMSLEDALNFYKSYVVNYDKVRDLASSDIPDKFISLLTKIIDIEDSTTLRELYNTTTITYDIGDRFTIESIIENAYYTSLTRDYANKQNGTMVSKTYKDKNGNDVELNMTELLDNFGIFVHSTCAYGEMPLLDDDYFISWNNNPRTDNHGICCSYITNSSYGTAAVENTGVMFGFTNINENSVATYSPYDLATRNNGYTITSYHTPFFTTLDSIPDFTRHTHNEFDLERRNYSISQEHSCVQPDCIIILEDMPESIKANSIKAYEDFRSHGIELKLIYIDRLKIAQNEASKLNNMITEYTTSYDMKLLADIINLYESNICGCDFFTDFNPDEVFATDKVRSILTDTVNYITNISDISLRNNLISDFIKVLESEQYKFDLLDDFNKQRAHTFKLYDEELKRSVEVLRSMQSENLEKGLVA